MPVSHSRKNNRKTRTRGSRYVKRHPDRSSNNTLNNSHYGVGLVGSLVAASALTQGLELEQNQNQHQNQSSEDLMFGGGRTSGCGKDIADHILCFLELLNTIKIYHWSTLSYPTHKATDELHSKMSELVDSFIEIYIGHCARGGGSNSGVPAFRFKSAKDTSISFCECKSLDTFCKVLDKNIIHLEGLTKKLDGYTDLVNIRDEMVGALAQALYLLRLH